MMIEQPGDNLDSRINKVGAWGNGLVALRPEFQSR